MREISLGEFAKYAGGFVTAQDIVRYMHGRPKSFPPLTVALQLGPTYTTTRIIGALEMPTSGPQAATIQIRFEDDSTCVCTPAHRFRKWNGPTDEPLGLKEP